MSDLAARIAALSPAKQALLRRLLEQQQGARPSAAAIPRRDATAPLPLAFAQQRLWFLAQLEPANPLYNIPAAFRVQGVLDVAALQTALDQVVARHEALRTTVAAPDGQPVQVVGPPRPVPLAVVDLTAPPAPAREAAAQAALTAEVRRPFDLTRDLLLRALLVRLGPAEHVLLLTKHHIASDGWSTGILWRELGHLYAAARAGQPPALPPLPIQYADYAVWQRQWLQGDVLAAQLAYWRTQLAGAPAQLALPTDRPRPAVQTGRGGHRTRPLPPALHAALEALSRQAGATLFMTLLAAFQTLLARYTGQEDLVVGSPIAGRTRVETEGLIGFFVNTLALRADLAGDPPFRTLLGRVREGCLEAYAHQELPFEKLVEELQPARTLSQSPLVQVMFVLQNAPRTALALPGLTLTPVRVESGTAKFDLTLAVTATDAGLQTTAEYNADLFDAATVDRLLGHYETLLAGVVATPDAPLSALPLLPAAERHQLLVEWNATATAYPRDCRIHELFEAQVARTPDAVAVVWGDQALTYAALNRRANQLAHHLRRLGVGPDGLVAVCLERTGDLVAALLGILKAGGAYLPLDPAYPTDRLAFMLADAQPRVVLTQTALRARLPASAAAVVCLDTAPLAAEAPTDPPPLATATNLAYVLYTSGSTGVPKGVAIEHRSVGSLVHWAQGVFTPAELAGTLFATSICFDLSVFEMFVPLSSGGTVILVADARALAERPARPAVTLVNTVPSVMAELLQAGAVPPSVRTVTLAGEPLPAPLADALYRLGHVAKVYDLYGPSETTVYSTCALRRPGGPSTIGRPLANTEAYVLDRHGQPVPIGVPGELYLGGVGLARGYLHRPALTAERFVPHPFAPAPGARLYRTGDCVRYRADGTLEFLGRGDHQVKLRGVRIELGEIEAVLGQHPQVQTAVAVVHAAAPGDRLVAYVVPRPGMAPTADALRAFLEARLPAYLVPATYRVVAALPLLPNGKVDRQALAAQAPLPAAPEAPYVAPRTPVEAALAQLWAELLRVERVGVHDDFFALGGHSLLATRVVAHLRTRFGVALPVRAVFESPTLGALALAVVQAVAARIEHGEARAIMRALGFTSDGPDA